MNSEAHNLTELVTRLTDEQLRGIVAGCEGVQGGPWKLDQFACFVWAPSEKGGEFPLMDELGEKGRVAEMRGWGYYTGNGHGALGLSPDEASKRQRLTGEHVARLDPQTVSSMASEVLSLRAELAEVRAALKDNVVVPREITLAMQKAYFDVIDKNLYRVEKDMRFGRFDSNREAYRAMLAARALGEHQ